MKVEVAHDTSIFIQASIDSVFHTIVEAVAARRAGGVPVPAQLCARR